MKIIKYFIIKLIVFYEEFIFMCIYRVFRLFGGGLSNIFGGELV